MPQLDPSTYVSQLFWLVVTFVVLYYVLSKMILPKIAEALENRQAHINHDLERATTLQEEADGVKDAFEAELAQARNKAQQEITAIKQRAAQEASAQQDQVSARLAADLAAAEQRIATARQQAMGNVAEIAVQLTESAVERLSGIKAGTADVNNAVQQVARS